MGNEDNRNFSIEQTVPGRCAITWEPGERRQYTHCGVTADAIMTLNRDDGLPQWKIASSIGDPRHGGILETTEVFDRQYVADKAHELCVLVAIKALAGGRFVLVEVRP